MKTYSVSLLDDSVWKSIEHILWNCSATEIIISGSSPYIYHQEETVLDKKRMDKFVSEHVFDGMIPSSIETNRKGVIIAGEYWVLPKSEKFKVEIVFTKPGFTSVQNLTEKSILKSTISKYSINFIARNTSIIVE